MPDPPQSTRSVDPIAFTARFVADKMQRQGGVPTFYDNHLRRLVAAAQGIPSGAPTEEFVGDARQASRELQAFAGLAARPRFQDPSIRLSRNRDEVLAHMAVPWLTYKASQGVIAALSWAGRPLFKSIYDLAAYPMLIAELHPASIIELGSGSGASAIWLADAAAAHGLQPTIISIDHHAVAPPDNRVNFLTGDIAELGTLLHPYTPALAHPWLVIEDAHVHLTAVLAYFDQHLRPGDYLIVEDSLPKRDELRRLVDTAASRYRLDTRYLDLFGENSTCAIDSIFRRE